MFMFIITSTCCLFLQLQVEAETQLIHQIKRSVFIQHFFMQRIHGAVPVRLFEGIKEMKILLQLCETQAGSLAASCCKLHLQLIQDPPHLDILLGR